ncbi:MAG: hypothetical protein EBU84_17705, partial [Actinobacteria bacterium]|nr:hypothetical protein [Actinomycetota bacterium]
DEEIDTVLYSHETPQMAAEDLVTLANDHGGRDNTTVIVIDVIIYDATPAGGMPVTEPMSNVDEVLQGVISEESAATKPRFAVRKMVAVVGVIAVIAVTIALIIG